MKRSGEWYDVPQVPGAYVVNLGDLMSRWTNDRWVSTPHRVVCPPPQHYGRSRRQSMAYFCNLSPSQMVRCIDTCTGPGNPPRYPPINAMEFLLSKHRAATGAE
jgi:isopenicillin N synthase-like dioxygenase